jgi:hypothetical protein
MKDIKIQGDYREKEYVKDDDIDHKINAGRLTSPHYLIVNYYHENYFLAELTLTRSADCSPVAGGFAQSNKPLYR